MKIKVEDILSEREWLHKELLNSLPHDIIIQGAEVGFYDVKLLVNGVELEPKFYNDLVNNIEKYVDKEANHLLLDKLSEAEQEVNKLLEVIELAKNSIIDKFNL